MASSQIPQQQQQQQLNPQQRQQPFNPQQQGNPQQQQFGSQQQNQLGAQQAHPKLPEQEFAKAVELVFKAFDTQTDGHMTRQEFNGLLGQVKGLNFPMTQVLADSLFTRVDLKKDGQLDVQELYSVLREYYYNR